MPLLTSWILAATVLVTPTPEAAVPRQIDVNCRVQHALERAIARAAKLGKVEVVLHGVCEGNFVIAADGITLRGATTDSGLAAPNDGANLLPVLEVVNAQANLQGLVVRGGIWGVLARGWDAEVFLSAVDVHGQTGGGVIASRGAVVRVFDSNVHDGNFGILAESSSTLFLQGVAVSRQRVGVVVDGESFAGLNSATITSNREAGLSVNRRSDVNIAGSTFLENGEIHVSAGEWSEVVVLDGVTIGSEHDATPYSLSAIRSARVASYSTPAIFGDVSVLDGGSIQFGNTVLNGGLSLGQFANAYVRDATITGTIFCADGSDAICSLVTTGGVVGCPSSTCGPPIPAAGDHTSAIPKLPVIDVPRFDLPRRARAPM